MRMTLAIASAILMTAPNVFSQESATLPQEAGRLSNLFDAGSAGGMRGIFETLKSGNFPAPAISVPVEDAMSDGTRFTSLQFAVSNSWMKTTTEINLTASGTVTIMGANKNQQRITLCADELAHLQALWRAAGLGLGNKTIGHPVADAPIFNLTYGLCGNSFHMCGKGTVTGSLVPSAWGDKQAGLEPLIQYLNQLQNRLTQNSKAN